MPSYLVESYVSAVEVGEALERARRTAELGDGVRYVRTMILPGDEMILHLFEAPSESVLDRAGRSAALPFERIVRALEAGGDSATPTTP
jgi:hypothetical protein